MNWVIKWDRREGGFPPEYLGKPGRTSWLSDPNKVPVETRWASHAETLEGIKNWKAGWEQQPYRFYPYEISNVVIEVQLETG